MKKLLITLATVALTGGSFANSSLWTNKITQHGGGSKTKTSSKSNFQTTNEDAEDIAGKLFGKSIQLDPNFWFGKNIKNYQSQLNKQIVKQGILTADEVKYVLWKDFTVASAIFYWNKGDFTVSKDGASCTGNVTLNASTGETTKQIAAKLTKANIRFNYDYWNNKTVSSDLTLVRSILVNEKILTKYEASNIVGFLKPVTITKAGKTPISFNVNDNNTQTYANANLNVVEDGLSSDEIAHKLNTSGEYDSGGRWVQNDTYYLKSNAVNQYADSSTVTQNFRNILRYDNGPGFWSESDIQDITLPHNVVTDNPKGNNMNATVTKDGQTSNAAVQLVAYTSSFLNLEDQDDDDMSFDVQLSPTSVTFLADYFQTHSNIRDCLGYFYQYLDDNYFQTTTSGLPSVDKWCVPEWDRLEHWMGSYGSWVDYPSEVAAGEANPYGPTNKTFGTAFRNKVLNSYVGDSLSVEVTWYFNSGGSRSTEDVYQTPYYAFW